MRRGPPEDLGARSPHPRPGVPARASLPPKHTEKVPEKRGSPTLQIKLPASSLALLSHPEPALPFVAMKKTAAHVLTAPPRLSAASGSTAASVAQPPRTHPSPAIAPGFRDAGASSVAVMGQQPRLSGGLVACARSLAHSLARRVKRTPVSRSG